MAEKNTDKNEGYNPEEKIPYYLFKDNDKYKNDVFVAVNGEGCLIKRGERVMLKRKFVDVLEQSMDQEALATKLTADSAQQAALV